MSDISNIWFLEEVNLFEYFCPISGAEDRYQKQPKRAFKKGEFIYFSDDAADQVYFIHKGAVKIAGYTEEGNEFIKAVLHDGEIFGELSVFGEDRRSDYAEAVEDTEICVLESDQVVGLMRDVSGFMNFLNRLMGKRIIFTQKRLTSLLYKDARTRIAEYLLDQAERSGRTKHGIITLRNYLTHQEIASYTGTSRQTVTTVLNEFREAGLIDFNRKIFTIRDPEGLAGPVA
jgi:CRP-like cAMP-binding protein